MPEFKESQHKRDESGKFSTTGGGGGAKGETKGPSRRRELRHEYKRAVNKGDAEGAKKALEKMKAEGIEYKPKAERYKFDKEEAKAEPTKKEAKVKKLAEIDKKIEEKKSEEDAVFTYSEPVQKAKEDVDTAYSTYKDLLEDPDYDSHKAMDALTAYRSATSRLDKAVANEFSPGNVLSESKNIHGFTSRFSKHYGVDNSFFTIPPPGVAGYCQGEQKTIAIHEQYQKEMSSQLEELSHGGSLKGDVSYGLQVLVHESFHMKGTFGGKGKYRRYSESHRGLEEGLTEHLAGTLGGRVLTKATGSLYPLTTYPKAYQKQREAISDFFTAIGSDIRSHTAELANIYFKSKDEAEFMTGFLRIAQKKGHDPVNTVKLYKKMQIDASL